MRHVYDRMIISPPLVISKDEVDIMIDRIWTALDQTYQTLQDDGLLRRAG